MAAADPSVGLNAQTGGTITGWAHVLQSLQDIFTTRFGSRIMREYYGSFVPGLLGRNINGQDAPLFMTAVASAILQWEPRFHITAIRVEAVTRAGHLGLVMEGEYRPRATLGDLTAEGGRRRVTAASGANWTVSGG